MIPVYVCLLIMVPLCTALVVLFDSDRKESVAPFIVVLALLILVSVILGASLLARGIKKDTPVNPSIEIKCTDNKCDTTYVYKFDQE